MNYLFNKIVSFFSTFFSTSHKAIPEMFGGRTAIIYNRSSIDSVIAAVLIGSTSTTETVKYLDRVVRGEHDNYIFVDIQPSALLLKELHKQKKHVTILNVPDNIGIADAEVFRKNSIDVALDKYINSSVVCVGYERLSLIYTMFSNENMMTELSDQAQLWKNYKTAISCIDSGNIFVPILDNSEETTTAYKTYLSSLKEEINRGKTISGFYTKKGDRCIIVHMNLEADKSPWCARMLNRVHNNIITYFIRDNCFVLNMQNHVSVCDISLMHILSGNVSRSDTAISIREIPVIMAI